MDEFSRTKWKRAAIFRKTEATQRHHVRAHVTSRACFKWRHKHCWLQLVLVESAELLLLLR